jgi:acyl-CoA synthetase (AMP-forming)/AMP-acid ligase II
MTAMHGPVPLLQDYLLHSARTLSDKVALVCANQRLPYAELDARSNALANTLAAGGVARGDRVVIFADNTVETVVSFWAALKANSVACIVNPLTKSDKLAYLLNDCRATALIADRHLEAVFAAPARACAHLRQVIVAGTKRSPAAAARRRRRANASSSTSRHSSTPPAPPASRRA